MSTREADQQPMQTMLPMELPTADRLPQVYAEGQYTLEQVPEPTKRAIIALRGAGYSIQDTAQTLSVHNKTVMAVDRYRPDEIATRKERTAAMMLDTADLSVGALRELLSDPVKLAKVSAKDLALVAAIMTDKGLLTAGEATHKVAVTFEDPGHAQFAQELGRIGLGAGAPPQKGSAAAADLAEPVEAEAVEILKPSFTHPHTTEGERDE